MVYPQLFLTDDDQLIKRSQQQQHQQLQQQQQQQQQLLHLQQQERKFVCFLLFMLVFHTYFITKYRARDDGQTEKYKRLMDSLL